MTHFRISILLLSILAAAAPGVRAQSQSNNDEVQQLRQTVAELERRVAVLEEQTREVRTDTRDARASGPGAAAALVLAADELREPESSSALPQLAATSAPPMAAPLQGTLPGGATLSYTLDGYYAYNFDHPYDQVNLLRAYDVSSNSFSLNQAAAIFQLGPDVAAGRRFGVRLDLQYGQATATLQGNPVNEARPDIWRNVFQAYGTWVAPTRSSLTVDFGKWASALGIEGNYTKDQMNYSRSYYFNYLPYYHMGARVNYAINPRLAANYWVVNGTQQTEDQNGFKDQLFGFVAQPSKTVNWTFNYYLGQEHPNTVPASNCTAPLQPGLCVSPISPAPDGKLHIFDSYATLQASAKLTLAGEADYVIEREWANSAPEHVDGGAGYAQYQLDPRAALAARAEYLSDRGGLFSNQTQALKEATGTYKYSLGDGFDAFLEYRRDWSNRRYFVTSNPVGPSTHQDTATLGLVWWYGGKQGAW
ncbi:MAG TPA: outer membrane beta-barrel protein [Acidobacteriaceae bacterium]|jgi:hypothetical protein|nr:outer membrane beta-barrel protein [Acidobacteriaceae bacterium]